MGILTAFTANPAPAPALELLGADPVPHRHVSSGQQAEIARQILQATREAEALILGRDASDLVARLNPESWCVAECLDHLAQTTCAFLPSISQAIADAPKLTRDRYLRTGVLPSVLIRMLKPPYRVRLNVLPQLAPQKLSSENAWSRFVNSQSELFAALNSTAGLAIDKVTVKSPVYARVSYNLYGAFRMLATHQKRHVWQIAQILSALDKQRTAVLKYSA